MPLLTLSKQDMLRSKIVDNGKYRIVFGKIEVKPSSTDGKPVYHVNQTILGGENEGVPILKTISIKMPKLLIQAFAAVGHPLPEDGGEFNTDVLENQECGALVKTGENVDGSDKNDIAAYFPLADL